jgi:DNA-binding transcriptional MocR family regulator
MPTFLMAALAARWMADGSAQAIIDAVRAEATARQSLAAPLLAHHPHAAHPNGLHVWLPLKGGWTGATFAAQLQRHGLAVVSGEAFVVDGFAPPAVRLSLGAARSRADMVQALQILDAALDGPQPGMGVV